MRISTSAYLVWFICYRHTNFVLVLSLTTGTKFQTPIFFHLYSEAMFQSNSSLFVPGERLTSRTKFISVTGFLTYDFSLVFSSNICPSDIPLILRHKGLKYELELLRLLNVNLPFKSHSMSNLMVQPNSLYMTSYWG